jgi:pyruvate,water dikinase
MECEAVKRVREEMGLTNLELMIPFVRTVDEELKAVTDGRAGPEARRERAASSSDVRDPANALLAEQFLEHCDGFSIGSNDLTQLTLGLDRDSELLTDLDERNEAVAVLMEMAIKACRKPASTSVSAARRPSDFPEITRWLVEQGIESKAEQQH